MGVAWARVGALAVLLALASGRSAFADSLTCAARTAHLRVVWENDRLGRPLSTAVEREVSSLFRASGVGLDWHARSGDGDSHEADVSVTVLARPRPGTLPPRAMGAVNRGSSRVWVFLSGIEGLLGHSVAGRSDDRAMAGQIIGRVVAHEIVHVIVPHQPHTREGLMQAEWNRTFAFRRGLEAGAEVSGALRAALACPAAQPPAHLAARKDGAEGDYSDDPSSS